MPLVTRRTSNGESEVRCARESIGWSQEKVAEQARRLGAAVARETVQRVEWGRNCQPETARRITAALKTEIPALRVSDLFEPAAPAPGRLPPPGLGTRAKPRRREKRKPAHKKRRRVHKKPKRARKKRRPVRFIQHFDTKAGQWFKAAEILKRLDEKKGTVDVLGRTCRSWLVGPDDLQKAMVNAAEKDSDIHLVVQKPTVKVPYFSDADMKDLREHLRESVASYKDIQRNLKGKRKKLVKLSFTNEPILQSMMRLRAGDEDHLLVSVRTDFKPEERQARSADQTGATVKKVNVKWDPQIIFPAEVPQAAEYLARFEIMLKGSAAHDVKKPTKYATYKKELLARASEAVRAYDERHGSNLRKDTGSNLAGQAVRHFLARSNGRADPPPVCVHLLVTPECPGGCSMCTQWHRHGDAHLPSTMEVKYLLQHVSSLGPKSVVLSGGDPLYREDIHEILDFATNGANLPSEEPLAVGLLTRGIMLREDGPSPLSSEDAARLAKTCQWIQLSIDTFENAGSIPRQSASAAAGIWEAFAGDPQRVEICFTIHSANVKEVGKIQQSAQEIGIPEGLPIRLKFAHSRSGGFAHSRSGGSSFLCTQNDLYELRRMLRGLKDGEDFVYPMNAAYLWGILEREQEAVRNVADGLPVEAALQRCKEKDHKCYVLDLTCTIDCDGTVYPCCYLFDDTVDVFTERELIDSLWDGQTGGIFPWEHHEDMLKNIWQRRRRDRGLPVQRLACARCTRHLHQNEFLNTFREILDEGAPLGIAEKLQGVLGRKRGAKGNYGWCKHEDKYFWL